jgi:hypothetical protein
MPFTIYILQRRYTFGIVIDTSVPNMIAKMIIIIVDVIGLNFISNIMIILFIYINAILLLEYLFYFWYGITWVAFTVF